MEIFENCKFLMLPSAFLLCTIISETNGFSQWSDTDTKSTPYNRCLELDFDINSREGLPTLEDWDDYLKNESCRSIPLPGTESYSAIDDIYRKCTREAYLFPRFPNDISCASPESGKFEDVLHQPNCYRPNDIIRCEEERNVHFRSSCCSIEKRRRAEQHRRPEKQNDLFEDCDGSGTIQKLAEMILRPHACFVTHNKSLTECMKTGMNGSKTYDNYENVTMNDINYMDFVDKVNQALENPDSHVDQCRTAFKIATCVVDGAQCYGSRLTLSAMVYEKIQNVTICAEVSLHDLVSS